MVGKVQRSVSLRQFFEDETLATLIVTAAGRHMLKGALWPFHPCCVRGRPRANQHDALHVGAGAPAVLPQLEQMCDFRHAETEVAHPTDETQDVNLGLIL
jgi:hypothetical protein